ncbi:MAG: hypothetical protein JO148_06360 [Acidimicrobiia bacterium]|nr:hypothetical protein [Acidimicrobiia bacterium]
MISEQRVREDIGAERESSDASDHVLGALDAMNTVLGQLARRTAGMQAEADAVASMRREGGPWDEVLFTEEARRLTTLLAETAEALGRANSELRRAQAAVLYGSGLSMERIGLLLGISRQRVAILLKAADQ